MYINITIHQSRLFMVNKAIWKLTILPKTFTYTPRANPKQKRVKRRKTWKGTLLLGISPRGLTYLPWRANTALCHTIVRRGEQMASKYCSLSCCSSSWRVMTDFCQEERFFTPKTQFSSTPIPNLMGNSTCDDSTTWISIIHEFNGFPTLLTIYFYPMT